MIRKGQDTHHDRTSRPKDPPCPSDAPVSCPKPKRPYITHIANSKWTRTHLSRRKFDTGTAPWPICTCPCVRSCATCQQQQQGQLRVHGTMQKNARKVHPIRWARRAPLLRQVLGIIERQGRKVDQHKSQAGQRYLQKRHVSCKTL
jgi:hypothetical protein